MLAQVLAMLWMLQIVATTSLEEPCAPGGCQTGDMGLNILQAGRAETKTFLVEEGTQTKKNDVAEDPKASSMLLATKIISDGGMLKDATVVGSLKGAHNMANQIMAGEWPAVPPGHICLPVSAFSAPVASTTPAPGDATPTVPGPAPGSDLGSGFPVTCSSGCSNYYGDGFLATNGVIDETHGAHDGSGGLAHTRSGQNEWIEVDFQKEFSMGKVTIWNGWQWGHLRHMSRINPFRLVFFDTNHNEVSRVSGLTAKTSGDGETPVVLAAPVTARYVRVQLDEHSDYLHIAELKAYAPL